MVRISAVLIGLLIISQPAFAGVAGQVIFAAGQAQVAGKAVAEGAVVQEGDMLDTGADGFMYVKTVDDGLFILRPKTRARIASYFVDAANPTNTRIKLELISGVARSRSGNAVKLARQNFRFNTPVAAIGVRGTDFTVFTDQDTSRVSVISGGIVVSAFAGACRPDGIGPCEGAGSRELTASQRGVLLQVQRGQAAPQLMQGGSSPDQIAPPQPGEPGLKDGSGNPELSPTGANLDAKKGQSVVEGSAIVVNPSEPAPPGLGVTPTPPLPPVIEPELPPVVVVPPVVQPGSRVIWGRWQPLMGQAPTLDFETEKANAELLAVKGNYVLFRTAGQQFVAPNEGVVGFKFNGGEAFITDDSTSVPRVEAAGLRDGKLTVDFGKRSFETSVVAFTNTEGMTLRANGVVTADGLLFGDQYYKQRGYMEVNGAISGRDGNSAGYIFTGQIGPTRSINGMTSWTK